MESSKASSMPFSWETYSSRNLLYFLIWTSVWISVREKQNMFRQINSPSSKPQTQTSSQALRGEKKKKVWLEWSHDIKYSNTFLLCVRRSASNRPKHLIVCSNVVGSSDQDVAVCCFSFLVRGDVTLSKSRGEGEEGGLRSGHTDQLSINDDNKLCCLSLQFER